MVGSRGLSVSALVVFCLHMPRVFDGPQQQWQMLLEAGQDSNVPNSGGPGFLFSSPPWSAQVSACPRCIQVLPGGRRAVSVAAAGGETVAERQFADCTGSWEAESRAHR